MHKPLSTLGLRRTETRRMHDRYAGGHDHHFGCFQSHLASTGLQWYTSFHVWQSRDTKAILVRPIVWNVHFSLSIWGAQIIVWLVTEATLHWNAFGRADWQALMHNKQKLSNLGTRLLPLAGIGTYYVVPGFRIVASGWLLHVPRASAELRTPRLACFEPWPTLRLDDCMEEHPTNGNIWGLSYWEVRQFTNSTCMPCEAYGSSCLGVIERQHCMCMLDCTLYTRLLFSCYAHYMLRHSSIWHAWVRTNERCSILNLHGRLSPLFHMHI